MYLNPASSRQGFNSQPVLTWVSKIQSTTNKDNKSNQQTISHNRTKQATNYNQIKSQPSSNSDKDQINLKEKQISQKLKQRDAQVRHHETAHKAAGGSYAGSVHYTRI